MEIKQIKFTKQQADNLLPDRIKGLLKSPGSYTFGAFSETTLLAFAVVSPSAGVLGGHVINYIALSEGQDENLVGELLKYIEDLCRKAGEKMISVRFIDDLGKLLDLHEKMVTNQYIPLSLDGHYLMYYLQDMQDTAFAERLEEMKALTDQVKFFNELTNKQIIGLSEKLKSSKKHGNFKQPDLVFGRFFVVGDEVKGFMNLEEIEEGILLLNDIYVEGGPETKYALPAMIASALLISGSLMPDDTSLCFQLYDEHIYEGFVNVFGEGEVDEAIFEYGKVL